MPVPRFALLCTLITAILIIAGVTLTQHLWPQYNGYGVAVALLVAFFSTLIAYYLTFVGIDKQARQFTTLFLLGMGAKMVVGIVSVLVVALFFKDFLSEYVVAFFLGYFILTGFEVYGLIRKLRAVS